MRNFIRMITRDHAVYFSKIIDPEQNKDRPDRYIAVIEVYKDIHKIAFRDLSDLKRFGLLFVANLPGFKEKELNKYKDDSEK